MTLKVKKGLSFFWNGGSIKANNKNYRPEVPGNKKKKRKKEEAPHTKQAKQTILVFFPLHSKALFINSFVNGCDRKVLST